MNLYIGLDVHAQSTVMVVLNQLGKKEKQAVLETKASALVGALKELKRKHQTYVVLEEGTQSNWLYSELRRHATELVVVSPVEKRQRSKSDFGDAQALAEDLRMNAKVRRVFKAESTRLIELKDAHRLYVALTQDVVRAKNRFKSYFRSWGHQLRGQAVFDPEVEELDALLKKVPASVAASAAVTLKQLRVAVELQEQARSAMLQAARKFPEFQVLQSVPGLGAIRAAAVVAVVGEAARFPNARKLWSYAGLGVRTEASAEYSRGRRVKQALTRGLQPGNSELKEAFKGAADTVVHQLADSPLGRHYAKLLEQKKKPHLARLTIARKIAAMTLAIMKSKEEYQPDKHHSFE